MNQPKPVPILLDRNGHHLSPFLKALTQGRMDERKHLVPRSRVNRPNRATLLQAERAGRITKGGENLSAHGALGGP